MQTRFRLFSLVGIPLYVHGMLLWCLGLLAIFLFISGDDPAAASWTMAGAGLTLICVVVHELGHALAARAFGLRVYDVVLHVLFGMTRMEPPDTAGREIAIGFAGPCANLLCAAALFPFVNDGAIWDGDLARSPLVVAFTVNLVLGGLNLVPAFPMDGGRLLRAYLAMHMNEVRATRIAVMVGRALAIVMIMSPIALGFVRWSLAIPVVGFLVLFLGEGEWRRVSIREEERRVRKFLEAQEAGRQEEPAAVTGAEHSEPPPDQPSN